MTGRPGKQGETIAVFDLDGTITTRDTTAAFLLSHLRAHAERIPRCAPVLLSLAGLACGFFDHAEVKRAALVAVLSGADRAEIAATLERFVPWCLARLVQPLARERIAAHRGAGHHVILASASFDLHVFPLARAFGIADVICTKVAWTTDGRISGALDGENIRGEQKRAAVQRRVSELYSNPLGVTVIAYSDHHADLPLLRWANQAVAVNPTRRLAAEARIEGIPIEDWGRS